MNDLKRAYGVIGVSAIMANWNADFDGFPKMIGDTIIGSDKALKYAFRNLWEQDEEHFNMYFKTFKEVEIKGAKTIIPKTLKEKYETTFNVSDLKATSDKTEVIKNLFKATDVKNFGATFAEAGANFDITGCVQIYQGINVFNDTSVIQQPILSPFNNSKGKKGNDEGEDNGNENTQSSIGSMTLADKAQYMYNFSVNPGNYKKYTELGYTEGYTREDYNFFKSSALVAATALNTVPKAGAENNIAIFIETDETLLLGGLSKYISYSYVDGMDIFNVSKLGELISECGKRIIFVELYYNPYTVKIEGDITNAKKFNIFTSKELRE